jgi:hypothetical protein
MILWCISLEWQEAHLDDGFTQTIPPASSLIFKWYRFFKPASHWPASRPWLGDTGPDWAIRALIGRYTEGGPAYVTAIHFLPAHSINIKHLRHPPSVWRTNVSHGVLVFTILSATYKQSTFMYILYNQLPLYVCALWKKNKYSFFLSFFLSERENGHPRFRLQKERLAIPGLDNRKTDYPS